MVTGLSEAASILLWSVSRVGKEQWCKTSWWEEGLLPASGTNLGPVTCLVGAPYFSGSSVTSTQGPASHPCALCAT